MTIFRQRQKKRTENGQKLREKEIQTNAIKTENLSVCSVCSMLIVFAVFVFVVGRRRSS